jgi:hypothetical protein
MDANPALLAVIGTIFGGAGLKIVESFLNRGKAQSDVAAAIRAELRTDVQGLRDEVRKLENELDTWKAKYYDLLDQFYKKGIVPDEPKPVPPKTIPES